MVSRPCSSQTSAKRMGAPSTNVAISAECGVSGEGWHSFRRAAINQARWNCGRAAELA